MFKKVFILIISSYLTVNNSTKPVTFSKIISVKFQFLLSNRKQLTNYVEKKK